MGGVYLPLCPGSKGVVYPKFTKNYFYNGIYGTMPSSRRVGLSNGNFAGFSQKPRGRQNHFSIAVAKVPV